MLKVSVHSNVKSIKTGTAHSASARVCMHVLAIARSDPRVMREATALVEAGFTVTIVDIEADARRLAAEKVEGVCLKHVRMPGWYISTPFPWSLFKALLMFIRTLLRLVCTPADIYHAHDASALPACYIAARLRRKPLILDAHELPLSEIPLSRMSKSLRSIYPLLTYLLGKMLPHCSGIIATSSAMGREITRRYDCAEVTPVRNFPFYQDVSPCNRLRQYLGLEKDVRIALYQGNIQSDRALDRLVRAARFLNEHIVIVMMGKADKTTLAELESLIASERVEGHVRILPPVPYAELLEWTSSADIGLSLLLPDYTPHMRVCLPNKLFEYLMAGLPVLASSMEAVAEVVNTFHVGSIAPSLEPAEIGAAINALLGDADGMARMHRNALFIAKSEFYWEKEGKQLIHLYCNLLRVQVSRAAT